MRAEAYINGWLLHQNENAIAAVPVLVRRDRWVYLTESGQYSDSPPEASCA
jgi:hypothetical protein